MATAVTTGTFNAEYAGEDLTVSKYATRDSAGRLSGNDPIPDPFRRDDRASHHINAARGTSQYRYSIANMAES